jgi:hypothetical protein
MHIHVESSGRGGNCVGHFSNRGMEMSEETLESWKQDATSTFTESFNCMTGFKKNEPQYENDTGRMQTHNLSANSLI